MNVSAYLDGELHDEARSAVADHLATCAACSAYAERIARVRHLVRVQPVEAVPDLTERIEAAVARRHTGRQWPYMRTAAVAAAAAFLIFVGTSIDVFDRSADVATAGHIVEGVRSAARTLDAYRATFSITERGWHAAVPTRTMQAEVEFDAPERFRLEIRDQTVYPNASWPRNDVTLVSSSRRWSITEPSSCPTVSLPWCASGAGVESRTIVDREPFDGNSALPTDIAIPIETLSDAGTLEVLDSSSGRHRMALAYHQAAPLVRALQPGGSWRPFHPLDRVEVTIDGDTWFPLRFRVLAGSSADRPLWEERMSIPSEPPGSVLLDVRATSFEEPSGFPAGSFTSRVEGAVASGRFSPLPLNPWEPGYTAGLEPYRHGRTGHLAVATYADGMAWLKISALPRGGATPAFFGGAEIVPIGEGEAFYRPADGRHGRRVEIFGERPVRVESNLPRAEVLRVATSLSVHGSVPFTTSTSEGTVVKRLPSAYARSQGPAYLPEGFRLVAAIASTGPRTDATVTLHYNRPETSFGGGGIRIVHAEEVTNLPPSSEGFIGIRVGANTGRWSFERGELEWIAAGGYHAVRVPGSDLATALKIAESLP